MQTNQSHIKVVTHLSTHLAHIIITHKLISSQVSALSLLDEEQWIEWIEGVWQDILFINEKSFENYYKIQTNAGAHKIHFSNIDLNYYCD